MKLNYAANKLDLHYYFTDNTHSMDASIRNKCECEFLATVYEVSSQLGIKINVDCEAFSEDGLRNIWELVGRNSGQIAIVLMIVNILYSKVPTTSSDLDKLKKEEISLSIVEKKLRIDKLNKEINAGQVGNLTI